uniref:Doublesex- and mab-3-related transcription factor C1/C2 C-terminal domain-containing protein n=2 Tax=Canis lupus familiaris TaxID=9615 RepID=A0A8C0PAA3_CANLF
GASLPKAHGHVTKLTIQAGVITGKENLMSQLEAHRCAAPGEAPEASDQDLVSASEWQRKLEAAEALLILRDSTQESSGSIFLLQPCVAAAPAGDTGLQPPSPSLRPRPATTISLPIGHLGCISLLS